MIKMAGVKDYVRDARWKRSEALDLLNTEKMIMEYIDTLGTDEDGGSLKTIKDCSLFDFWKYVQQKKDES